MELYYQYIRDIDGLRKACSELNAEPFLGIDTETTELDPRDGELRLIQFSTGKTTYVIDMRPFASSGGLRANPELAPLRGLISDEKQVKIAHNAKFDSKWVRFHLGCEIGNVFDSYLASQLISAGDGDRRHSLADTAQFFTGIELDKSQQVSDWSLNELSQHQVEYAARDAAVLIALREQMAERLRNDGLDEAARLEFECVMPVAEMELNGFFLDAARWREHLDTVRAAQAEASEELQTELSAGVAQTSLFGRSEINLDSHQQVTQALLNLGIPVPETTRAWQLQPLAAEYPVIQKLLDYRTAQKSLTSFGDNILEYIDVRTGRIHADFRQIGSATGRFSCSNPNLQQMPAETAYRRCFRAPEGRKLIIADYSQIELRILADFSEDQKFIAAFLSGEDFHSATAAQVFNVSPNTVTPDQRAFAKRLNFGMVYGVGAPRIATMSGISVTEAENMMRRYFGTYRGLDAWLRETAENAVSVHSARTRSGRLMRFRFDEKNQGEVGAIKRIGKNMPIQGTSADILKRALRLLHTEIFDTSSQIVNIVHDEIVVECDEQESQTAADIVEKTMTEAAANYVKKLPVKVDVRIADEWSK